MSIITDFEVQGKRVPKVVVHLDGAPWATIDAETLVRMDLRRGQKISEARKAEILLADETVLARRSAARHCAGNPKTRRELEHHLIRKGFSVAAREAAIRELESSGTIDDPVVAGRIVRSRRSRKSIGPLRLKMELAMRGIENREAEKQIDAAFEDVNLVEECLKLAEKIRAKYEPIDVPAQQAKMARYLLRRGYEGETVRETIERMRKD
ncbi:RecX family transcriptional regulator [bacterium]|nr:RecX family transcriptional regulator [bacterium]